MHKLKVKDLHYDQGVAHIRFREKREKRFSVMLHPVVQSALFAYLQEAGIRDTPEAPLFLSMKGKTYTANPLSTKQLYNIIKHYGKKE